MKKPTLLTVILNYKTADMTLQSLAAALMSTQGINGEIIIVDNDSQDGSFEKLTKAVQEKGWSANGRVRVLQSGRNGGFGAGNNVGIKAGLSNGDRPDYVYILNSDAFPNRDTVSELLNYLETHPKVGFAGSYIHGQDGEPHLTAFRFPSVAGEFEGAIKFGPISRLLKNSIVPLPLPEETCQVDWLAGASLMMRQAVLDQIGLFDERFFCILRKPTYAGALYRPVGPPFMCAQARLRISDRCLPACGIGNECHNTGLIPAGIILLKTMARFTPSWQQRRIYWAGRFVICGTQYKVKHPKAQSGFYGISPDIALLRIATHCVIKTTRYQRKPALQVRRKNEKPDC